MSVRNQVQLITYPDSLGGNLENLNEVLQNEFADLFPGGIHILPPYPSSGDRGFAPLTYLEIDPKFGTWVDIRRLGEERPILLDLMVNHISAKSEYFLDFRQKGRASKYADLFITLDKIWPDGKPDQADLEKIFLRRAEPYSEFTIQDTGETEKVWTSFGKTTPSEQIDLDVHSPLAKELFQAYMANFSRNNVEIVRLDAVGYVIKKCGSSCFFVEPEIFEYLEWISDLAKSFDIELLPEVHAEYEIQSKLAKHGYWIYDFILPYTILETLIKKSSGRLKAYLKERPPKQFTMLDCHDGLPIKPDLNGLYRPEDAQEVVDICLERGARLSRIITPAYRDPDGFDVHQIQGTIYSLLGCNDTTYLMARAIQFFTPGIPQVYYVGLLAGKNDEAAADQSGDGRDLNRHNYNLQEIKDKVQQPVVRKLMALIRFRNTHPAFDGKFEVGDCAEDELVLTWRNKESFAQLSVNLTQGSFEILSNDPDTEETWKLIL